LLKSQLAPGCSSRTPPGGLASSPLSVYTDVMKLLGTPLSPYAARVMIAARAKGMELAVDEADGWPGSATLRAVSPIGKIPVLVDGDIAIPESEIILGYLDDCVPNPPLFPGDARQRANTRLMVRLMDTYSTPSFAPFLPSAEPEARSEALRRIGQALGYIDHFRLDGEFASGEEFSAADCAWIPFFHYFETLQPAFGVLDQVRRYPRLDRWWGRARATPLGEFARGVIDEAVAKMFAKQRGE